MTLRRDFGNSENELLELPARLYASGIKGRGLSTMTIEDDSPTGQVSFNLLKAALSALSKKDGCGLNRSR